MFRTFKLGHLVFAFFLVRNASCFRDVCSRHQSWSSLKSVLVGASFVAARAVAMMHRKLRSLGVPTQAARRVARPPLASLRNRSANCGACNFAHDSSEWICQFIKAPILLSPSVNSLMQGPVKTLRSQQRTVY